MSHYNLCIVKPNRSSFSETFVDNHIQYLRGNKTVLYGGSFPVYQNNGQFLIPSKLGLLSYLFQKRIMKRTEIPVRTKALVNWLLKNQTDAVLAEYGTVGASIADACMQAEVPLLVHFHGADAHHRYTIQSHDYQKAFKNASAIIGVSEDMLTQLQKLGAPKDKLILIPYGVDTSLFNVVDVANSAPNFLSIGRFVEKKSPLSLIKAFSLVTQQVPEAHLWMVGNGALFRQAQQFTQKLGIAQQVTFTGVLSTSEIAVLMEEMRCFVQHSVTALDGDMEGTPVAILEAAAAGLPVVSTQHAGIKQAVVDTETGFLVDEHDLDAMAQRMIQIASSATLSAEMGLKGRQHIVQNYQLQKQIAKLDDIIQHCIKANRTDLVSTQSILQYG